MRPVSVGHLGRAFVVPCAFGALLSACGQEQAPIARLSAPAPVAIADGPISTPPAGWVDYCRRNPKDPSCAAG